MKTATAYRYSSELCFFFSLLSIFPALRPYQTPMALFAAACFVAAMIAVHVPWAALRLPIALLPALCFIGVEPSLLLVFPAFGWIYLIFVLTAGRFSVYLDDYRNSYRWMLTICLCAIAANVAHGMIMKGQVISTACLIYAMLFLALGVLAMRRMQMNAEMGAKWKLANALSVVGVPVLAVGCSLLIFLLLRFLAPGVEYVFKPIGLFVAWLLQKLFSGGWEDVVPTPDPEYTPRPTPQIVEEQIGSGGRMVEENIDEHLINPLLVEKAAAIGAYVVLAVLLLVALWLVLKYARRGRELRKTEDYEYEETEAFQSGEHANKKQAKDNGPAAQQLRRIYRKYLELMREGGVSIRRDSTSHDVLEESGLEGESAAALRLRELYLKARYGEEGAITHEDVREARRCLKEIREQQGK